MNDRSARRAKAWVKMIAFQLLFIAAFMIALHDTRIKDESNTETIVGVLEEYSLVTNRTNVYLTSEGETYVLMWHKRILKDTYTSRYQAFENVNIGDIVCLTVQKDRDILYFGGKREVVAFEANGVVIYDIADHNSEMLGARMGLYIFAPLIWIVFTFYFGIQIALCKKSKKRKRKKS